MRNTGLSSSIGLIALGAVLAWAVTWEIEGINITTVGFILFAVGILGVVVTLVATASEQKTVIERNREVVMGHEQPPLAQQMPPQQTPVTQQAPPAQHQAAQPQAAQPQAMVHR